MSIQTRMFIRYSFLLLIPVFVLSIIVGFTYDCSKVLRVLVGFSVFVQAVNMWWLRNLLPLVWFDIKALGRR